MLVGSEEHFNVIITFFISLWIFKCIKQQVSRNDKRPKKKKTITLLEWKVNLLSLWRENIHILKPCF